MDTKAKQILFEGEEHGVSHDFCSVNKMLFNITFVWGGSDGMGGGGWVSARVSQVRRAHARTTCFVHGIYITSYDAALRLSQSKKSY